LFVKTQGLALGLSEKLDTSDAYRRLGVPQDPREYTRAAFSLQHLGITHIKLLTNNPRKITGIEECGITVEREPLEIQATSKSKEYLSTKARKMGHLLAQFSSEQ
jgi:GTP cyclohydrolase II